MKHSIEGFSQERIVQLGLDHTDALILRWFVDWMASGTMDTVDHEGTRYHWVLHAKIIEELPSIRITNTRVIARRLQKMVTAGVLRSHLAYTKAGAKGTFTTYAIGPQYLALITGGVDSKVQGGSTQKYRGGVLESTPKDSSSRDSSTRRGEHPSSDDIDDLVSTYSDIRLQTDPQSLQTFHDLDPDSEVVKEALVEWLAKEKGGGTKKLAYFNAQSGPYLTTARERRAEEARKREKEVAAAAQRKTEEERFHREWEEAGEHGRQILLDELHAKMERIQERTA